MVRQWLQEQRRGFTILTIILLLVIMLLALLNRCTCRLCAWWIRLSMLLNRRLLAKSWRSGSLFLLLTSIYSFYLSHFFIDVRTILLQGGKIGRDLFRACNSWVDMAGGLGNCDPCFCTIFSAISWLFCRKRGLATIGNVAIKEMKQNRGYNNRLFYGLIAAGGTFRYSWIPPSNSHES